jgi:hypothetical protein
MAVISSTPVLALFISSNSFIPFGTNANCIVWLHLNGAFLGTFAKLLKTISSFLLSVLFVRLSAWNNSAPTGRIFMKLDI